MFWFRFLGSRSRDNNVHSSFTFFKQEDKSDAKLKLFDPCEFSSPDTAAEVDELPAIRSRGSRRSAIDLSRTGYSLDIGPHSVIRLSLDMFSAPSYQLANLLKGYADMSTLHRGSHARIMKADKKVTEERVIFKLYEKATMSPSQLEGVFKELEVLKKGASLGTVVLLDVFEDERLMMFSLKECAKGSLMACIDDHGGSLSEEECVKYLAAPLTKILSQLHENGIVHRDVKPEHILFDQHYNPYLCDFYNAGIIGQDALTDREGTLHYMAPEVVTKPTPEEIFNIVLSHGVDESDLPSYNEKADVWSLGAVIVEAMTGQTPFAADLPGTMIRAHADHFSGVRCSAALKRLETSGELSADGQDFLSKIFRSDPNDRATAHDLLYHPWLQLAFSD